MKLTLLSNNSISCITLPEKHLGKYWVRTRNEAGKLTDIVSVEALRSAKSEEEDVWELKSNRRFKIVGSSDEVLQSVPLQLMSLYNIRSSDGRLRYTLFVEPVTEDRRLYSGYMALSGAASITIGRNEECDICYDCGFVSRKHATLVINSNEASVKDEDSTNNTYVNDKRVKYSRLNIGDVVYIMGLRIIFTGNGIFLNNPDGKVTVNSGELREFRAPSYTADPNAEEEFEEVSEEYYYRAPRFKHDVDEYELKIDAPPAAPIDEEMPMIMMIGPSLTMGMASVASGAFTVVSAIERGNVSSAIPSLVMCISMLLGTLMWPIITKTYQKKLRIRKETRRQESYTAYLAQLESDVAVETARQESVLRNNDISVDICTRRVLSDKPMIWERTPKHSDFLLLRLGCGNLPLKAKIHYPEWKFAVERDNLTDMMYQFGEKKRWLKNVPVCLSLHERFISGIYGKASLISDYVTGLIFQLVTTHSYDEVKLVMLYDESDEEKYSFTRWLPHTMNDERTVRYIATNSQEAKALSSTLDTVIEKRKKMSDNQLEDEKPYYFILCLDKELALKTECVRRVLENKSNIRFSVLSVFDKLIDLPKECMAVAEITENSGSLTLINDVSEPPVQFTVEANRRIDTRGFTRVLSNTFVNINGSGFTLPKKYTFFEMLDIGMIEHLNLAENWSVNDPTKSLAAAVGIDKYGELFRLDLHEKAHGPHGLVAGMTGSGKSEFIISYILSMAVNFHPYEVAFILIDYKGGGMAKSFENIPHTAGVITNLDGNGIKRSLSSMASELHRRERIFRDTSKKYNISNIDIYKYQKLYREGKVSEPLPHLFIISDEFAELKKEQPEFMTELTSTARVGRSLGVHLILATQKPGGVVDDQVRSNSRFKICLKVQDSSDSQEMLGRPDAASLTDTGRFYLQVGYNELFEIGQSAWAGAPYYPSQRVIKDRDDAISVINTNGQVVAEANTNRFAAVSDPPKQLDVITKYIQKYCEEENIKRWSMWLDPIPAKIYVDKLTEKYPDKPKGRFLLNPVVGEYDDPAHQRQCILRVPLSEAGNAIVYGSAGNGKAMFIEAMCYSVMREHTPDEVNIYIADFGSETLTAFSGSPFVGDVILAHETEKMNNLFKLLMGKLQTRKKKLAQFGGSIEQYNSASEQPEPLILVFINNYAAFAELYEERTGDISYLTREGTKYGIHFVLACTGINNVRLNMMQNFKLQYCLQMNNADDYSSLFGKTEGFVPEKHIGRGMFRRDKDSLLEFQTARITEAEPPYPAIREFCKEVAQRYKGSAGAAVVPVLPEKVTAEFLAPYAVRDSLANVPVGVEKDTMNISVFDFTANVVNMVMSSDGECDGFVTVLGRFIAENCGIRTIMLAKPRSGAQAFEGNLTVYNNAAGYVEAVNEIFTTVLTRNNRYKDAIAENRQPPEYPPLLVVISSISSLSTVLNQVNVAEDKREADDDTPLMRLQLAMAKCEREYNVHFIISENISAITPFTAEEWYKKRTSPGCGIWLGSGINSQFRLNVTKKPPEYQADIKPGFGFAVNNSAAVYVKFLQ
ncbi:MAG: type VII secretion protein EssC [Ruminiclostridium sp.]